jgi:hypothetical protein
MYHELDTTCLADGGVMKEYPMAEVRSKHLLRANLKKHTIKTFFKSE